MTTITVAKWGNSVGIRLPKEILATGQISVGDALHVEAKSNLITLKKIRTPKKYRLEEVLRRFDTPDFQGEFSWGVSKEKGTEIW